MEKARLSQWNGDGRVMGPRATNCSKWSGAPSDAVQNGGDSPPGTVSEVVVTGYRDNSSKIWNALFGGNSSDWSGSYGNFGLPPSSFTPKLKKITQTYGLHGPSPQKVTYYKLTNPQIGSTAVNNRYGTNVDLSFIVNQEEGLS